MMDSGFFSAWTLVPEGASMVRPRVACLIAFVCLAILLSDALQAVESCGPPPPAAPQRRTGGESFPPLPLPATPLRRTEKKRQPRPPSLFAKVAYGPETRMVDGKQVYWPDWKTDPGDSETLLRWVGGQLGVNYGSIETSFAKFSYDPSDAPVLYLTGHNAISMTQVEAGKLRAYLQDGGFLVADACCGSRDFDAGFRKAMEMAFPDRPLRVLPLEHPLFSAFADATTAHYLNVPGNPTTPLVMGIDIGCRTAVFYFPRDVSCGWAGHVHDTGERYTIDDARKLGANLVTYIIADYQLGRYLASAKLYYQSGEKTRDEFVFGQIVHEGDCDPSPSGIVNLLEYVDTNSSIHVQYKKVSVDPGSPEVFNYPFLYIQGHYDFRFSDAAVANLKRFLQNGGVLFGESCCGRREFDAAFRREIARVIGADELKPIPLDSPVYRSFWQIDRVGYTPYAEATVKGLDKPLLEGASVDGTLAVIYSPLALSNGWEQYDHPYSKGYDSESALKIGMNVLVYAMSH